MTPPAPNAHSPMRPAHRPHVVATVEPSRAGRVGVRVIAVWEAVKGVLVLLAAGLAIHWLQPGAERAVEELVAHFHLNPAGPTLPFFERAAGHLAGTRLVLLAVGAGAYALLRFVEAWGLWAGKRWGWILGIGSAALYLPLEILQMVRHFSQIGVVLFLVNVAIVVVLWLNRTRHVRIA